MLIIHQLTSAPELISTLQVSVLSNLLLMLFLDKAMNHLLVDINKNRDFNFQYQINPSIVARLNPWIIK